MVVVGLGGEMRVGWVDMSIDGIVYLLINPLQPLPFLLLHLAQCSRHIAHIQFFIFCRFDRHVHISSDSFWGRVVEFALGAGGEFFVVGDGVLMGVLGLEETKCRDTGEMELFC